MADGHTSPQTFKAPSAAEILAVCRETGNELTRAEAVAVAGWIEQHREHWLRAVGGNFGVMSEVEHHVLAFRTALSERGQPHLSAARFEALAKAQDRRQLQAAEDAAGFTEASIYARIANTGMADAYQAQAEAALQVSKACSEEAARLRARATEFSGALRVAAE